MKPVIAATQIGGNLYHRYMKSKYTASLRAAGAEVRWIDLEDETSALQETLACDGLVLTGGPDVDPELYGQVPCSACGESDALRDRVEMKLLDAFLATGKPILGICRGEQLLNVYFGGTICQDITLVQKSKHKDYRHRARSTHTVKLLGGTKLRAIFGEEMLAVNSLHHQVAEDIGGDLVVAARSDEGFVEALELPWHRFCIGVQWHPEHMARRSELQRKFLKTFVAACKRK